MKLTTNTEKLLKILIVLMGLVCTILIFGVLTRTPPVELDTFDVAQCVKLVSRSQTTKIRECLTNLQIRYLVERVRVLQERNCELEREVEIASLTPMQKYVNYAYEISDEYYPEINPEYVCAIMHHESRFDSTVTNSKTGVKGLCQISPKWHTKRAAKLGVTDLYDPWGNIMVCYDILNELTQSKGIRYAINFYAGGYNYANRYLNSMSPFEKELEQIMDEQNFAQYVLPYSIH